MGENRFVDGVLPLDRMTIEEKLRAMEMLWDDLCRNEQQIPVSDWQKELLDERQRQIDASEAKFSDWESVKKRLRDRESTVSAPTFSASIKMLPV
jgi:putative addiction module component (TIGR02574 family)